MRPAWEPDFGTAAGCWCGAPGGRRMRQRGGPQVLLSPSTWGAASRFGEEQGQAGVREAVLGLDQGRVGCLPGIGRAGERSLELGADVDGT